MKTIRIQLENVKDHREKNGKTSRRRRIRQVIMKSDLSSNEECDMDAESEDTSGSSDEDSEQDVYRRKKKVLLELGSVLTVVYSYSAVATPSWPVPASCKIGDSEYYQWIGKA